MSRSNARFDACEKLLVAFASAEIKCLLRFLVHERHDDAMELRVLMVPREIRDKVRQDRGRDEVAERLTVGLEDEVSFCHFVVKVRPDAEIREQQHCEAIEVFRPEVFAARELMTGGERDEELFLDVRFADDVVTFHGMTEQDERIRPVTQARFEQCFVIEDFVGDRHAACEDGNVRHEIPERPGCAGADDA